MAIQPCVYILASGKNGTLYVGVTSNLTRRIARHRSRNTTGFTNRYEVYTLAWYEPHETMESAIKREKSLKDWNRGWKIRLIRKMNPEWRDLADDLL